MGEGVARVWGSQKQEPPGRDCWEALGGGGDQAPGVRLLGEEGEPRLRLRRGLLQEAVPQIPTLRQKP